MSVSFNLQEYQLTCHSHSDKIVFRLEPLKVENKVAVQYLYQAEYRDPNLPEGIKFLFNESTTDWYRYIEYYRERCFDIDLNMIKQDENSDPNVQIQYTELPFIFKMKLIQGIKESRFRLYGQKELFSKELKLERMLVMKENVILDLKKQIDEKDALIEELEAKLRQVNQEKEQLIQQNSRLLQHELPRKKLHYSQQPEQGCFSNETNGFQFSSNNEDSNSSNKSQKLSSQQAHEIATQHYSTQNQPSSSYANISEPYQNEVNEKQENQIQRQPMQQNEKHSQTFYNRPNKLEVQQNGINAYGNEMKSTINLTSVSMNFQNKKNSIEEERKLQEHHVQNAFQKSVNNSFAQINQIPMHSQPQSSTQTQNLAKDNEKQSTQMNSPQPPSNPQVISAGGQLMSEESLKMIRQFSSKKCLMEVGFDERSQKKYGYCCIFCEKIFKEDDFLSKHLFSRHAEVNNETTLEYLTTTLSNFKKRRDQKIAAFEANYAAERKLANRAQILQGRT